MKFCIDCAHYIAPTERLGPEYGKCGHEEALNDNYYVTGDESNRLYCSSMRVSVCGKNGKLWEPKPDAGQSKLNLDVVSVPYSLICRPLNVTDADQPF